MTVDCPLDCVYLQEARVHEKPPVLNPDTFPNPEIRVTDEFLAANEALLLFVSASVLDASLKTPGAIDYDVREALESLVQTYRTLQSGLYYESRPANPLALAVLKEVQRALDELRAKVQENGEAPIRDSDLLGMLVFLQRMELQQNNGRRRGRAFIDFLRRFFPNVQQPANTPMLIQA